MVSILELNAYLHDQIEESYAGYRITFSGLYKPLVTIDLHGNIRAHDAGDSVIRSEEFYVPAFSVLENKDTGRAYEAAERAMRTALFRLHGALDARNSGQRFGEGVLDPRTGDAVATASQQLSRAQAAREDRNPFPEYQFGWRGFHDADYLLPAPRVRPEPPRKTSPLVEFPEARKIRVK